MRIDAVHVDHYGGLDDLKLDLNVGFQVIKGLNEEGKTTLLAFIRGVIFGFKHALPHIGVKPVPFYTEGERMGGRIEVTVELDGKERRFAIIRHTGKIQDGELSIRDLESNGLTEGRAADTLRDLILGGGVDKTLFNNVFVLTVDDLHELKSLTQEEVADALFSADAGVGLDLAREISSMRSEIDGLYNDGHRRGKQQHRELAKELKNLNSEIYGLNKKMKELSGRRGARERMNGRLEELRKTRSGLVVEVKRASDRITAREHNARVEELMDDIAELPEGPFPTDSDQASLESLRGDISVLEEELDELDEGIESLENKQSNLVNAHLYS